MKILIGTTILLACIFGIKYYSMPDFYVKVEKSCVEYEIVEKEFCQDNMAEGAVVGGLLGGMMNDSGFSTGGAVVGGVIGSGQQDCHSRKVKQCSATESKMVCYKKIHKQVEMKHCDNYKKELK